MPENRERDRGPVLERLITRLRHVEEDIHVACPGLGHGESNADELRLFLTIRSGERTLVEWDGRLGIARHVQQTRLQEQAIRGLVMIHRGLDGCQRSGAVTVAPMDVRDHQVDVGALVRGSVPCVGKNA